LLEKTAVGNYRLGSEMIALGGRAMRGNSVRHIAHPLLRQLAEETGERVTLELLTQDTQNGYTMLVLDEVASTHLLGVNQFVGSRLPVHATSTGKALLAHLPDQERRTILSYTSARLTPHTKTTDNGLTADLEAIRSRGYALAMGELELGLMATAAPIFNHNGDVVAALSIVGPSVRLDEETLHTLGRRAQETAEVISYKLGYRK
jgi:DNA-binding IclR family transcriptional regulator